MGHLEFWGPPIGSRAWDAASHGGLLRLSCGLDKWEAVVGWGEIFSHLLLIELELPALGPERRSFSLPNLCHGLLEVMKEARHCCSVSSSPLTMINSTLVSLWGTTSAKSCALSDRITIPDACLPKGKSRDGCEISDGWMRCPLFRPGSLEPMTWMERMAGRSHQTHDTLIRLFLLWVTAIPAGPSLASLPAYSCPPPFSLVDSFSPFPSSIIFQYILFCLSKAGPVAVVHKRELCLILGLVNPSSLLGAGLPWGHPSWPFAGLYQFFSLQWALLVVQAGDHPLGLILMFFWGKALLESWEVSQLEMSIIYHPFAILVGAKADDWKMVPLSIYPTSQEMLHL